MTDDDETQSECPEPRLIGKKGASPVYLIADTRERKVIPFLEDSLKAHAYVVKQINVGDYLICRLGANGRPKILCCIERKSHTDFADSFRDGRWDNIDKKMIPLRKATGCQLYVFMEGPAFPSPSRRFNHIPFANILSAATNLMVHKGIFVVQTEDESHTAKRIADFLVSFDSAKNIADDDDDDDGDLTDLFEDSSPDDISVCALAIPESLSSRGDQTPSEVSMLMWAQLRGVSVVLGKILSRTFSVHELVSGLITPEQIRALKTITGRQINKDAVESLLALRAGSTEHAKRIISGLRNITPAVADIILTTSGGISRLCSHPAEALAMIQLPRGGGSAKLGKLRADRIRNSLYFKEGGMPPPPDDTGNRLGGAPVPKAAPKPAPKPKAAATAAVPKTKAAATPAVPKPKAAATAKVTPTLDDVYFEEGKDATTALISNADLDTILAGAGF